MPQSPIRRVAAVAALIATAAFAAATPLGAEESRRAKVKVGKWTGTAVDDKYGATGTISFTIRKGGRELRNLRMNNMVGDCPGQTGPVLNVRLPKARIKPSGLMRGHHVFGDPGDSELAVVSYDARFRGGRVTDGRIYQDSSIDDTVICEVAAATFSAKR